VPGDAVPEDRAVVDRVVDGRTAVLLVGPGETEAHVDVATLPPDVGDGTWVVVDLAASPIEVLGVDRELTRRRSDDISARLERIRRQRRGGRFGR
jgi:hypothetical protein